MSNQVVPPYPSEVTTVTLAQAQAGIQIAVNQPVSITGLTANTRYRVTCITDKHSTIKVATDGSTVADGQISGTPVYISPAATTATITVTTFATTVATLTVEAAPIAAPTNVTLPSLLTPNVRYKVTGAPGANVPFILSLKAPTIVSLFVSYLSSDGSVVFRDVVIGMNELRNFTNLGKGDILLYVDGDSQAEVNFSFTPAAP